MLEAKLKARGISKEQLEAFASRDNHNGKKDVFRWIVDVMSPDEFSGEDRDFLRALYSVLQEEGLSNWDEYFPGIPDLQKKVAAQLVAAKMLGRLCDHTYGSYTHLSIDELYRDTFRLGE